MDPNATLAMLRSLVRKVQDSNMDTHPLDRLDQFAEHFEALDEWIESGGFLPDAWTRKS
jgi:hypothetical protein